MIFAPDRVWRTRYRPAWPGAALLVTVWYWFVHWWSLLIVAGVWAAAAADRARWPRWSIAAFAAAACAGLIPVFLIAARIARQ